MRPVRRLPPLVRLASIVGALYLLASIGLLIACLVTGWWTPDISHHVSITAVLIPWYLGVACSLAESFYREGLPLPDRALFWLELRPSRVLATVLLLLALPLCAYVFAFVLWAILPPTVLTFWVSSI